MKVVCRTVTLVVPVCEKRLWKRDPGSLGSSDPDFTFEPETHSQPRMLLSVLDLTLSPRSHSIHWNTLFTLDLTLNPGSSRSQSWISLLVLDLTLSPEAPEWVTSVNADVHKWKTLDLFTHWCSAMWCNYCCTSCHTSTSAQIKWTSFDRWGFIENYHMVRILQIVVQDFSGMCRVIRAFCCSLW